MDKKELINALKNLNEKLKEHNEDGELLIFGGASMCLAYEGRDNTKDIDALFEPKEIIQKYIEEISEENGLPKDWLNDGVKGFINGKAQDDEELLYEFSNLSVYTVSAEYLLSMKLLSSRVAESNDIEDIKFLMRKINITTAEQTMDILTTNFDEQLIPPKTQYVIEACVDELAMQARQKTLH